MTHQEQKLWQYLRNRQINNCRFRRQYPIGPYIVDFICLNKSVGRFYQTDNKFLISSDTFSQTASQTTFILYIN